MTGDKSDRDASFLIDRMVTERSAKQLLGEGSGIYRGSSPRHPIPTSYEEDIKRQPERRLMIFSQFVSGTISLPLSLCGDGESWDCDEGTMGVHGRQWIGPFIPTSYCRVPHFCRGRDPQGLNQKIKVLMKKNMDLRTGIETAKPSTDQYQKDLYKEYQKAHVLESQKEKMSDTAMSDNVEKFR